MDEPTPHSSALSPHSSSVRGHTCAICELLDMPPRRTASMLTVETRHASLLRRLDAATGVVPVPVCPEHAVDVYRGRVAGVAMAWRVLRDPPEPARAG